MEYKEDIRTRAKMKDGMIEWRESEREKDRRPRPLTRSQMPKLFVDGEHASRGAFVGWFARMF
jgi:hypothetical protein